MQLCPWIVRLQDSSGCCESVLLPEEVSCLLIVPFFMQLCADEGAYLG